MYVPVHFEATDVGWCHALIRREPFALLIGVDQAGSPFATH
jgi:predicted FMN-binding regulatory protein PaiB